MGEYVSLKCKFGDFECAHTGGLLAAEGWAMCVKSNMCEYAKSKLSVAADIRDYIISEWQRFCQSHRNLPDSFVLETGMSIIINYTRKGSTIK